MVDEELKLSAFDDMCTLITANPGGIVQDFVPFCGVIGSFTTKPSNELKKKIVNVKIQQYILMVQFLMSEMSFYFNFSF